MTETTGVFGSLPPYPTHESGKDWFTNEFVLAVLAVFFVKLFRIIFYDE